MNAISIISVILSVLAIVVTIIISRKQMKRNTVIHFRTNEYDIGKGLSDEFSNLKLTYSGIPLTTNVKAMKGGLMNRGKNDINTNSTFELIFPDNCIVRDFNIKTSNGNIEVIKEICEKKPNVVKLTIKNGIFRTDNFFEYTALVETPEKEKLGKKINFEYNILNTDIKDMYVGTMDSERMDINIATWVFNILVIIAMLFVAFVAFNTPLQVDVINNSTNEKVEMFLAPGNNIYEGTIFSGKKISSYEALLKNYSFVPNYSYQTKSFYICIIGGLIYMAMLIYIDIRMFNRGYVYKVLKRAKKTKNTDNNQE